MSFLRFLILVAIVAIPLLGGGSAQAEGLRVTERVKRTWGPYNLPSCDRPCTKVGAITLRKPVDEREMQEHRRQLEGQGFVVTARQRQDGGVLYTLYRQ